MTEDATIQTRILHGLGDACMMIGDIAEALELNHVQISNAAASLITRGYLERLERGCFQLTGAGRMARDSGTTIENGVTGPTRALRRPGRDTVRQRAWSAIRITRTFTLPDIVVAVARDGDGDVAKNLQYYVKALADAGYLARSARRRPGTAPGSNGYPIYRLVRDTGPVAPVYSAKHREVRDLNSEVAT